jgi:hypothetical protein
MDFIGQDIDELVSELSGDEDDIDFSGAARPVRGKADTYAVKDLPIGFAGLVPTTVGIAGTSVIDCPVKTAFRPDRLVLEAALAAGTDVLPNARVNDIIIGTIRLNVGSQPVPGRCFRFDAIGTRLRCAVVATPSVFPQVSITNTNAAAIAVEGGFFGPMKRV